MADVITATTITTTAVLRKDIKHGKVGERKRLKLVFNLFVLLNLSLLINYLLLFFLLVQNEPKKTPGADIQPASGKQLCSAVVLL